MRSLEEWTKYLEQQEQSLQETLKKEPEKGKEPVVKSRKDAPAEPVKVEAAPVTEAPEVKAEKPAKKIKEKAKVKEKTELSSPIQEPEVEPAPAVNIQAAVRMRKRLPQQLNVDVKQTEVAQKSYTSFRESREDLLQRLLDPALSLEDAARVLNVCPTTVRRYTNRGLLRHYRTAGNQRRFKLSDILEFMERQNSGMVEE